MSFVKLENKCKRALKRQGTRTDRIKIGSVPFPRVNERSVLGTGPIELVRASCGFVQRCLPQRMLMILQFPLARRSDSSENGGTCKQSVTSGKNWREKPKKKRIRNTNTNGKKEKNLWTDEDIGVLLDTLGEETVLYSAVVAIKLRSKPAFHLTSTGFLIWVSLPLRYGCNSSTKNSNVPLDTRKCAYLSSSESVAYARSNQALVLGICPMLLSTVELYSSIVVRIDIALRLDFPLSRARIHIWLLSQHLKTDRFRFMARRNQYFKMSSILVLATLRLCVQWQRTYLPLLSNSYGTLSKNRVNRPKSYPIRTKNFIV